MPRIFVVEDDEFNRDMISRRLIRKGFEVECAATGWAAIERIPQSQPDLILLDLRLPDMHGLDIADAVRANAKTCNIPMIAFTAHAIESERQAALRRGCDDFDTKPVDFPRLITKIGALLERGRV